MELTTNFFDQFRYNFKFDFSFFSMPSINFIDIIDILLVAFLFYQVLIWIKDTRAWTLFKGIILIVVISLIALFFRFNTILWIFEKTISVGIIAIIIVFQPELRKALEHLGRGNLLASIFMLNDEYRDKNEIISVASVESIIDAVKQMSKVKTGALIVIEQEIKMGEYERSGIAINAKVSSQLLLNIFEHNTPLHDGAVIISNNRIEAATCFLPLSDDPNISMELGTRHRAAVGLSEISDAKVLVVSEEKGTISMAYQGNLFRNIDEEFIRKQLIHIPKKKKENKKLPLWKGRQK